MSSVSEDQQRLVRVAARALAKAGLVTAFGHCSQRLSDEEFLVCAAQPMGLIQAGEPGTVVRVDGPLPDGVLGEVRMHQQIYRRRTEVKAICRFLSPQVMALAAMGMSPSARHGFSSYFYPRVPMWADPALVRNDAAASGVADVMGDACAVIVGVNGAVTAADSMQKAVSLAWLLEDSARVELAVRAAGGQAHVTFPDETSAKNRATWDGRIAERLWDYMTAGDAERT
ncbi:MAG: class II aldolase/adducin family protein [Pseudomonadota bacterium]